MTGPNHPPDKQDTATPRPASSPSGLLFGAVVGLLAGATVGFACCWLADASDALVKGGVTGAGLGLFGGALIGRRGRGAGTDIATTIWALYGVLPGLLILFDGAEAIRGKFSTFVLLGMACAGPMGGLLIGGLLDRVYESIVQRPLK